MIAETTQELLKRIEDLEGRLAESEQLIEAIKTGEVDAFAVNENNQSEIYTLQSGDYAYRLLIEEFGEGAVNISEDGLIVYTNAYFVDLLQSSYEQVIGRQMADFVHADSLHKFKELFNNALSGRSKGEINLQVNQKLIPVYVSLTSLQPKLATVGIIITDQSEKKQHEGIVLQYQKDLELKNLELAQSNVELGSFSYIASHDLQEPLRKIQTFCNRILESGLENLPAGTTDYFKRIVAATTRMQNLISSLLNYSRMNTDTLQERTNLNVVLQDVIKNHQEQLEEFHVRIEKGNLPEIQGIQQQFAQLFTNLISNAIKYRSAERDPEITITAGRIHLHEIGSTFWKITVSDNGIGFDPQYAEKIFELFQRLHTRFEYEGTGIGLAICKKIVQNHKGFIRAFGKPGAGASFEIYLPVNEAI